METYRIIIVARNGEEVKEYVNLKSDDLVLIRRIMYEIESKLEEYDYVEIKIEKIEEERQKIDIEELPFA